MQWEHTSLGMKFFKLLLLTDDEFVIWEVFHLVFLSWSCQCDDSSYSLNSTEWKKKIIKYNRVKWQRKSKQQIETQNTNKNNVNNNDSLIYFFKHLSLRVQQHNECGWLRLELSWYAYPLSLSSGLEKK